VRQLRFHDVETSVETAQKIIRGGDGEEEEEEGGGGMR
jgi:hypothetical protein